jgi:hypothetical protein
MMQIQKFINNLTDKNPANIRSQIYKRGILSSYDPDDGRMVFYSSKNQRFSEADNLKLECNGLVFDTQNNKPLVIPPILYRSNIDNNEVNHYLKNNLYDILKVEDGTVINLYWWDGRKDFESHSLQFDQLSIGWRISTARSYDITDKAWGSITYKKVIKSILGVNEDKFYNSLDKSYCYTFGIKTGDSHPFWEGTNKPINKIWFIQSVCKDFVPKTVLSLQTTDLENQIENLKIKEEENIVNFDFPNDLGIPNQTVSEINTQNIKDLFYDLNNGLDNFIHKGIINYGYIFRSKNPSKTGGHSNILLESSLLQKIRQLYYHSNLNEIAQEMKYDRNVYILIHAYLDINKHGLFTKLFPQYLQSFTSLDEITINLVKNIIAYSNIKKLSIPTNKMSMYTKIIYESFTSQHSIKVNEKNFVKLITSYLLTHQWINIYYTLFTISE